MTEKEVPKSSAAQREEEMLKLWQTERVFEATLEKESPKGEFIFYEGPPTANGRPGIHHLEARAFKDLILRFKTMHGYHVRRKGGWDTHGLPVELEVEKKLGFSGKRDIETYGIAEFNKQCRESVWTYVDEWERFTRRIAYWIDTENPYVTYDPKYMESLWSVVGEANKRELVYKDYKVLPWCPRCGTALSSHELAQGYKEVKDLSVYVKFKVTNAKEKGLPDNTYLLAWTTTPWTLPGNVALAVGENIEYTLVTVGTESFLLAKELLAGVLEGVQYTEVKTLQGKELLGLSYEPLYPFLKDSAPEGEQEKMHNAWKVYGAHFVTTDSGTGIVHTAVMYGQDDFELGTTVGLPKHHLVNEWGEFKQEAGNFAGKKVYEEETAIEIIKDLHDETARGYRALLKKEKYEHTYPFCWRCKTRLIYFARDSWYFAMSKLREEMIKENSEINWEPGYIREGRFGEWLRDVKDWAISRERYWGTPLPVWESSDKRERLVIDSLAALKKRVKTNGNTYLLMRHGEALSNVEGFVNCEADSAFGESNGLTEKGKQQVQDAIVTLQQKEIDIIFVSPLLRAQQTAELVAEKFGIAKEHIIVDKRLIENKFGVFEGKSISEYHAQFETMAQKMTKTPEGGENWHATKRRMSEVLYELEKNHTDKTILIISHNGPMQMLQAGAQGLNDSDAGQAIEDNRFDLQTGEVREISFVPLPHNEAFELDLHRPYIDEITLIGDNGGELTRVKEVMDVWFDSGCMPFAQDHYPFENKEYVDSKGFPADYICEAIDQTRGWFYTLHAVGAIMNRGKAYKNVISLGHILDSEGKKMSKSLGNIVNPWDMLEKYGADVLRFWMYSVNQPGEPKYFDEKTVEEVRRKVFSLLENVESFYSLYASTEVEIDLARKSNHVLDTWILSKSDTLILDVTKSLEEYKVLEAARSIREFIGELSQWYIRRSRDRFKSDEQADKHNALATTRYVLEVLAKLLAPFAPFYADEFYRQISGTGKSVHLCAWPEANRPDEQVLTDMARVRTTVSLALEARTKAGIKVRQPLARLTVPNEFSEAFAALVKDEVNVKEVVTGGEVSLDTDITPELQKEGDFREFLRQVQELRKQAGLNPQDRATLTVQSDENGKVLLESFAKELKSVAGIEAFSFTDTKGTDIKTETAQFIVSLTKK